jgi:CRP-like cAMP-binding protein
MKTTELTLAEQPFFQGLSKENIRTIARYAKIMHANGGDLLFQEGGHAGNFYVIIKGKVALETYAPGWGTITLQTVEDGEILGWSWLIDPYKYRFGARVITNTEIVVINGDELRIQFEKDSVLGYEIMKRMIHEITSRLEQTRLLFMDVYANPAYKK